VEISNFVVLFHETFWLGSLSDKVEYISISIEMVEICSDVIFSFFI